MPRLRHLAEVSEKKPEILRVVIANAPELIYLTLLLHEPTKPDHHYYAPAALTLSAGQALNRKNIQ